MLLINNEIIDDYKVKSHIKGGMSNVYVCEHINSSKLSIMPEECVIKFPDFDIAVLTEIEYRKMLSEFKTECSIAAKLSLHSSFINVFSAYQRNSYPYLKMEKADKTISIGMGITDYSLQLIMDVLLGLSWAETSLGIIHGAIKPSNILVKYNRSKICDFGLSIFRNTFNKNAGTKKYAAPEILSGGDINTKSDIYSLGVTVYEILFGTDGINNIFSGKNAYSKENLKDELLILIESCISKKPADRPGSFKEIENKLGEILVKYGRTFRGSTINDSGGLNDFVSSIESGVELNGSLSPEKLGDNRVAASISYDSGDFIKCINYLSSDYDLMVSECVDLGITGDLIKYAQALSEVNNHDKALDCLRIILNNNANNAKALQVAGYIFRRKNAYDKALEFLQASKEIDDSDAETWNNLGLVSMPVS